MRIPQKAIPKIHGLFLTGFVALCLTIFVFLWTNSGGRLPGMSNNAYQVTVVTSKASNLVTQSEVTIAGVRVGTISDIKLDGEQARITLALNEVETLHEGASVDVRQKTLVQETYLEITDGKGKTIKDGATLPIGTVKPAVGVNDILNSLDPSTRTALRQMVNNLSVAADGTSEEVARTLQGLGDTGRGGKNTLVGLAGQTEELKQLVRNSTTLVDALNARQGQLVSLVTSANQLMDATASKDVELGESIRILPGVLLSADDASSSLTELGQNLAPLAQNLRAAAPDLSAAVQQLPGTTSDLRALLPALDGVLDRAPATLTRVPATSDTLRSLIPSLRVDLRDVNPMLAYVEPYGRDVAAFFTGFGQALNVGTPNGKGLRIMTLFNEQSYKGFPINTNIGPLNRSNPYPAAGSATDPGPFTGKYPQVKEQGSQ